MAESGLEHTPPLNLWLLLILRSPSMQLFMHKRNRSSLDSTHLPINRWRDSLENFRPKGLNYCHSLAWPTPFPVLWRKSGVKWKSECPNEPSAWENWGELSSLTLWVAYRPRKNKKLIEETFQILSHCFLLCRCPLFLRLFSRMKNVAMSRQGSQTRTLRSSVRGRDCDRSISAIGGLDRRRSGCGQGVESLSGHWEEAQWG